VTRLDRLARSTRDLLNTLAAITAKKAGFRSLGDTWADTTTSHGPLMLSPSWRAGGVWARSNPRSHRGRRGARRGARCEDGAEAEAHSAPAARGPQAPWPGRRNTGGDWPQLQCQPGDDFEALTWAPQALAFSEQKGSEWMRGDAAENFELIRCRLSASDAASLSLMRRKSVKPAVKITDIRMSGLPSVPTKSRHWLDGYMMLRFPPPPASAGKFSRNLGSLF